jgi:dihydropteroate synthase
LTRSPALADLAAKSGCALVVMHNKDGTDYQGDVMTEIRRFLKESVQLAVAAGVPHEQCSSTPASGSARPPSTTGWWCEGSPS